jgi:hypothetical protein
MAWSFRRWSSARKSKILTKFLHQTAVIPARHYLIPPHSPDGLNINDGKHGARKPFKESKSIQAVAYMVIASDRITTVVNIILVFENHIGN